MTSPFNTYESAGHAILKCRTCKHTGQLHYETRVTGHETFNGPRWSTDIRDAGADRWHRVDPRRSNPMNWALYRICTACGSEKVTVNVIKGVLVEEKRCDGRCMGATGPVCECSCGGKNHGRGSIVCEAA